MRIDAHQHFWRLDRGDLGWLTPRLAPIWRDFGPDDLAPLLEVQGIAGTVLVQAFPDEAETLSLLDLAAAAPFVKAVVGWTDLAAPDAPGRIAALAARDKLRGLRPMIQDIADPEWMLDPALTPALRAMAEAGLVFDALVLPQHLVPLLRLLDRHPDLVTVIDHAAKPRIRDGAFQPWAEDMARLAAHTGAACKLSGLVTEAGGGWTEDRLRPYTDHLLQSFGPQRLIWGSDWPVCTLAASYERWCEASRALLAGLDEAGRAAVEGGTATRVYRLH